MYPLRLPTVASNAPAEAAEFVSAMRTPSALKSAFIVERTFAVGGTKLAHLAFGDALSSEATKPFLSIDRMRNEALCPGRRVTSAGMICSECAGPGFGHGSS